MTENLYSTVEGEVGRQAAVEITAFSGHLLKTVRLMQAWGLPDIKKAQLEEFVEGIAAGDISVPDHARVPASGASSDAA
jgi:hypothetical protein